MIPKGSQGREAIPFPARTGSRRIDHVSPAICLRRPHLPSFAILTVALVETHLKRPAMYDPNPNSAFSPLPPAFNHLSRSARRDQAAAGQRAELDKILQPGYKTDMGDPDSASIAGPSRSATTAGGFADRRKKAGGLGLRPSASLHSFKNDRSSNGSRMGGIYVDSNGKVHDQEYDPFGGVAEIARRKTRRRSAFGSDRRKGSGSSSSSASGSEVMEHRESIDGQGEDDIRRRLEVERRRMDEVSGLAAARRRSMLGERGSGRATPSIRSGEDGPGTAASTHMTNGRSKSQQGYYVPSPLSPTFAQHPNPSFVSRNLSVIDHAIEESPPQKSTERTTPKEKEKPPMSISVTDKKTTVTGFDAPRSARPLSPRPHTPSTLADQFHNLRVPDSARMSVSSRNSSDSARPPKPPQPPRADLFPETPAQAKRREERERHTGMKSRAGSLGIDTVLSQSGRGRTLPEIEIVEDDDPRIVFPEHGKVTRVQTKHDHVIKGPFSHALHAQGGGSVGGSARRGSADMSIRSLGGVGSATKAPSSIIEEAPGGYLPSRWANGDKELRVTEDEREKYRPREWGGKTGDLGGRHEEWK